MDKVAMYKEQIYKQAGVILGTLGGALGGVVIGGGIGDSLARRVHKKTPEVENFEKQTQNLRNDRNTRESKYNNALNDETLDSFRDSLKDKNMDNMTVGELENSMYKHFNNAYKAKSTEKTASLKSTLISAGITGGLVGAKVGKAAYNATKDNNTNADKARKSYENAKKQNDIARSWGDSQDLPRGLMHEQYNIDHLTGMDTDGIGWTRGEITDYLSHHKKDVRSMKFKDYKKLSDHVWENGEFNRSKPVEYYLQDNEKKAYDSYKEEIYKQASTAWQRKVGDLLSKDGDPLGRGLIGLRGKLGESGKKAHKIVDTMIEKGFNGDSGINHVRDAKRYMGVGPRADGRTHLLPDEMMRSLRKGLATPASDKNIGRGLSEHMVKGREYRKAREALLNAPPRGTKARQFARETIDNKAENTKLMQFYRKKVTNK